MTPAGPCAVLATLLLVVPLSGCTTAQPGGEETPALTPSVGPTGRSPTPGTPPSPTPAATPDQNVVEDSLAILDGEADDVERVVAGFGGEIVDHVAETDTYVVRFDVGGIADLIALRDELRAVGLDANLIPFLPTLEG